MNVQELIDTLSDMNPESEVKLAVQPEWAFQHRVGEVVEVPGQIDGLRWGVKITYIDDEKESEFEEAEANTDAAAFDLRMDLASPHHRMIENGIQSVEIAAILRGQLITKEQAEALVRDEDPIVYLSDGGQEKYLPEAAAETLGWSRRDR
jgi:hypothetical protein